jgi:hypothetical protein
MIIGRSLPGRFTAIFAFAVTLLLLTPAVEAQRGGGYRPGSGDSTVHFVPWRYLEAGVTSVKGPLTLYWLPSSREDLKRSELQSSRKLTAIAAQCVGMDVVLPEDAATIEKLGATGKLPQALLTDADGNVVRRTENVRGTLKLAAVEQMVEDELSSRDASVYAQFSEAKKDATAGQKNAAIDLFRKVWEQRCMFPAAAGEAQRALKVLGVIVSDAPPAKPTAAPPPTMKPATGTR